jgi:hypothetical protein
MASACICEKPVGRGSEELEEVVPINDPLEPVPVTWPELFIPVAEDEVQPEGNGTAVAPPVVPIKPWELPECVPVPAT